MAEGAIKPEIEDSLKSESENKTSEKAISLENNVQAEASISRKPIVWTPGLFFHIRTDSCIGSKYRKL